MKRLLGTALALLTLAGCSSIKPPTAAFSALDSAEKTTEASASAKAALEEDFQRALQLCDSQMLGLRESFYGSGKTQISIATVGIIAGSIVVPALAAKAAAASFRNCSRSSRSAIGAPLGALACEAHDEGNQSWPA